MSSEHERRIADPQGSLGAFKDWARTDKNRDKKTVFLFENI